MRRSYRYTLCAFALPRAVSGGGGLGNVRKMHFAGLGDGHVDTQGLRGAGNKRKRKGRRGDDRVDLHLQSPLVRRVEEEDDAPRHGFRRADSIGDARADALDDVEFMLRKGADRRAAIAQRREETVAQVDEGAHQSLGSDGPWQLSVLMLLGIMGVLLGMFVHFSTDPNGQAPYLRRRMKKKPHFHSPSDGKKTDRWNDDEEVSEDYNYRGDTEGGVGGSIAKKRSPMPKAPDDPTARLYFQMSTADNFRQQEHRFRKSATQQNSSNMNVGSGGGRVRQESTVPAYSPSRTSRPSPHSGNSNLKARTAGSSPFPTPPPPLEVCSVGGTGLEGFEQSNSLDEEPISGTSNLTPQKAHPLVKRIGTFTPTESFASMSSGEQSTEADASKGTARFVEGGHFDTPPISLENDGNGGSPAVGSPRQASKDSERLSELPTPRVNHTRSKLDLARTYKEKAREIGGIPLSLSSAREVPPEERPDHSNDAAISDPEKDRATPDLEGVFPGLPLVPSLDHSSDLTRVSSDSFHVDAPRSVLLEELQLVRMESGVSGPKWRTKYELRENVASTEEQRQQSENLEKLREASAAVDPADDPRNSIQHIRKDLTISSDASSSLSSKIMFSELKLEDVIGGGGFGQVWRARWKGTPVAVKVLTGSAQAETVPKAVLEEFIAEINMVSGMRHPNICLFMGACLEPPNRAIVTELCENGSLWDALRSPLSAYEVADGLTRQGWPLDVYEPITHHTPTFQEGRHSVGSFEPPLAPGGAWPWILVKRVAAGTARGMCYLHSGNPPVLHRDLKSANILLDESYTAKLADFGLSRLKAVRSGMTGNCGTVQWMAPEVLCSENYAEPADVFSFGIIVWEMLTKECPYDGMTPIQCALSVLNENRRPEIPEWCPLSLRALIKNCVERDPRSRPTFSQILSALDTMP